MADEEQLTILRQRVEAGYAGDPEQQPRAAGRAVAEGGPEERHCSFGVAVATDALEAVVGSLRKRPANAAAGVRIEAKRGSATASLSEGTREVDP